MLLDHCVPAPLRSLLGGHVVLSVRECALDDIDNGALLKAAAQAGFDAILTLDKGFAHEHDPRTLPISVVIVRSRSSDLNILKAKTPAILAVLHKLEEERSRHTGAFRVFVVE